MEKNPINRMFRLSQIKNNIWFNDFNWEGLINLNLEPAYKLKLTDGAVKESAPFVKFMEVQSF